MEIGFSCPNKLAQDFHPRYVETALMFVTTVTLLAVVYLRISSLHLRNEIPAEMWC